MQKKVMNSHSSEIEEGDFGEAIKFLAFILTMMAMIGNASAAPYQVAEKDIATLPADMTAGRASSADLVRAYTARIVALDREGPQLHAIITINPNAVADAIALDVERRAKGARDHCTAFQS
jgi:amidase